LASTYDFVFDQGTTISRRLVWKRNGIPVDLTGWNARMEIKDKVGGTMLFRLDPDNGRLALGGEDGSIDIHITADESSAWPWKLGVYDIEVIDDNGNVGRLLQGKVKISQEVTTGA